jgi:membrane peptidoglycan carboxypeptidase
VTQLTRGEAAFLAGLPQSPYTYDPYTNFTGAKLRQRQVLDLMVLHGYLSLAQADEIFNQPPLTVADLASPDVALEAPHFTVEVRRQLESLPGLDPEMITRGGLSVYTTLDMDLQKLGEQIVAERIAEVRDEFNMTNAALVALSPHTGEVLALVGSVDYHDEAIDGAVNNILSPHQPGSTMKPLTYAAALELGWEPADVLWDVPITYDLVTSEYEPVNYDERFHGPVRLREALARSYNVPAVMLLNEVGVDRLLELAARFGVQSLGTDPAQYGLSLTLGGGEVQPMEMAIAFGVFASGGYRVQPVMITRVVDSDGNLLYEAPGGQGEQVLDPRIAFMISDILSDNDARAPAMGIDSPLLLDGIVAAAKTGTTNDFRDNWTVGYTPHLVVAVWAGNTDNEPMAEGTSGLAGAAPIWNQFMTEAYALTGLALLLERPGLPPLRSAFTPPASLEQRQVCVISTLRDPVPAEEGCSQTRSEWFRTGDGGIEIKPTDVPTPTPAPTVEGDEEPLPPMREEIERGLLRIGVFALSEGDQRDQQVEALAGVWEALPGSAPEPVPPPYCVIPQSATGIELEDVAFQVFIAAPRDPLTALYARNWAYQNGVPIDPGYECPPELVDELLVAEPITDPATGAVYAIDDPNPGEEVYGVVPVIGTALFDPEIVDFYKIEIGPGETPGAWITLGGIYEQGVEDSVLEYLHADASDILPPGPYVLRLVLVLPNGDILPPYEVPITIVPVPQDEDG